MNDIVTIDQGRGALAPVSETGAILNLLAQAIENPAVDVAKLSAVMDLQERVLDREALRAFNRDFMAMSEEMPRISKDGAVAYKENKNDPNSKLKEAFRFATIEHIHDVIDPILRKYGFALMYDSTPKPGEGGGICATVTLIHKGGHEKKSSFSVGLDTSGGKSNAQGMHSSYSLAKRVATFSILNLVHEGQDDGGVAGGIRYITDDKKQEIIELMKETNTDTVRFLQHLGVSSLDEIEHKNVAGALNALLTKKASLKK